MIYLFTGNGKGKTTAALGIALRSLGHNRKVAVVQFMKGRKDIGEYKAQRLLKNFKVHQFGTRDFVDLKKPKPADYMLAEQGWNFAKRIRKVNLLILDELNLACAIGLLETDIVAKDLRRMKKQFDIIITGRYAPGELLKESDAVIECSMKKFPKTLHAKKGIEY